MTIINTSIPGLKIIEPDIHRDARGYFCETYNRERYFNAGITAEFVRDNESCSSKGVIRGLHWQAAPHTQAKLVRVIRGSVWDVAVDIRKDHRLSVNMFRSFCRRRTRVSSSFLAALRMGSSCSKIIRFSATSAITFTARRQIADSVLMILS